MIKGFFNIIKGFFGCILFVLTIIAIPVAIFAITQYGGMLIDKFFSELSEEHLEIIYKFACIISPFLFIAVPVVIWGLYFRSRKRKKEIIRKSEENNTFVTARLVRANYIGYDDCRDFSHAGIYEYTANGKTKERRICFRGYPPEEVRLYPKNENGGKLISNSGHEDKTWFDVPVLGFATIILWIWVFIPLYILSGYLS